jgi:hypothetical protein
MEKPKEEQFADILRNIKEMRNVMDACAPAFRSIFLSRNIRLLFLIGGCCVIVFTLAYHTLLMVYDFHISIPTNVKTIYFWLILLTALMLFGLRIHLTRKARLALDKNLSLWKAIKLTYSSRMWQAIIPVQIILIILPFKMFPYWPSVYYVPYIAFVYGTFYIMFGLGIRVVEYSIAGCWLIITGLMGFYLVVMPVHIAVAVSFAPAYFLFALIAYMGNKESNYNEE